MAVRHGIGGDSALWVSSVAAALFGIIMTTVFRAPPLPIAAAAGAIGLGAGFTTTWLGTRTWRHAPGFLARVAVGALAISAGYGYPRSLGAGIALLLVCEIYGFFRNANADDLKLPLTVAALGGLLARVLVAIFGEAATTGSLVWR
jgi:hypothetical protein